MDFQHFGVNGFLEDLLLLCRLFSMLQHFLVESKGRRKKLHEVGYVTTICFVCSLIFEVFGPVLEVIIGTIGCFREEIKLFSLAKQV
ncbi:hypothetical protein LXL04_031000 [Taraxacum kok-saghyz]